VCTSAAPYLFILGERLCLGDNLQVLSSTTRFCIRHQRTHFFRLESRQPPPSYSSPHSNFLVLKDTSSTHLNFSKAKPINANDTTRCRVVTSYSMLLYLSDDVASATLQPHLAPGVRRCSAITLRLGRACALFGRPPSSVFALNESLQQASTHRCSSR
jgi:hypothetical protein